MIGAIQTGALGMEKAARTVDTAASRIAKGSGVLKPGGSPSEAAKDGDLAGNMVDMIVGQNTYDANAKVIETAAKMLDKIV